MEWIGMLTKKKKKTFTGSLGSKIIHWNEYDVVCVWSVQPESIQQTHTKKTTQKNSKNKKNHHHNDHNI